jgi:hypothetical protein
MNQADSNVPPEEISYVMIPADTSKPLLERTVLVPAGYSGDYLVDHLQKEFSVGSDKVDIALLQQQAQQTLSASPNAPASVSDQALQQVAQQASVESFTLVHPAPSNKFMGIQIYLDEAGMLKRLPLNTRASDYARRAGFEPPPQFYGDTFMARVQKTPAVRNLPFSLGVDTALNAPWLQKATTENLEYQSAMNEMTGRTNIRQSAVAGSDGNTKREDGFSWTQTEGELEVAVPIPATAKSKDIQVKFRPQQLQVIVQKEAKVSFQLFEHVDVDGCTWTIDRTSETASLVITMEKMEAALWPRIID